MFLRAFGLPSVLGDFLTLPLDRKLGDKDVFVLPSFVNGLDPDDVLLVALCTVS